MPVGPTADATFRNARVSGKTASASESRTPAQRDRDRILHSSAFRRLAAVTQVVAADEGVLFHNRLTHSLKVAQIARRVAERLVQRQPDLCEQVGGVDPDVVEAAALAHDLGHPPFGHIAEKRLQKLTRDTEALDGFEGNAQSFRIVTTLAVRGATEKGLDLTRATLNAILKYPWCRDATEERSKKWGAYASEDGERKFAREDPYFRASYIQSAEAAIMDLSDDIAYALHDVEDFYRVGWIPLERLAIDPVERRNFFDYAFTEDDDLKTLDRKPIEERVKQILEFGPTEPYVGTRGQRAALRSFISQHIGEFADSISLIAPSDPPAKLVEIQAKRYEEILVLKRLTRFYVIRNPSLATHQAGQLEVIAGLYNSLGEAAGLANGGEENLRLFPTAFQHLLGAAKNDGERRRLVVDLIAGLTERQAIRLYHRLTGIASNSSALESMIYLVT